MTDDEALNKAVGIEGKVFEDKSDKDIEQIKKYQSAYKYLTGRFSGRL